VTVGGVKSLLASLVAAAVLTPGASAASPPAHPSTRDTVVVVREPNTGFDWPDALIGAGAASGLALALAGGALVRGRKNGSKGRSADVQLRTPAGAVTTNPTSGGNDEKVARR
jgi:hypothetical protein